MAELEKTLSTKAIFLITVNSIMGTGIYFLPALGAEVAGPASVLSWVILSVIAIYVSMCLAELTGMFPTSGGIYEFAKRSYGHFFSFLVGWMALIAGNVTIAMLIVGAIQYLSPVHSVLFTIPLFGITLTITNNTLISLLFIFIFNFIAYRGMRTSSFMLMTFAFITLGTMASIIFPGFFNIQSQNFDPFFVSSYSSIFVVIFLVAETFFGWETATYLAAETKNGAKVMPKVLIGGTIVIALICLSFVVVSIGMLGSEEFGGSGTPVTDVGKAIYGSGSGDVYTILVYLAIIGSVAGWVVSAPRLVLSMAEDKLFISSLAKIHPKYKTPYKAIIFQTFLTSALIIIASGTYKILLQILVPIMLLIYSAVLVGLVILRYKMPEHPRPYKAPFGKTGPFIVVLILISLVVAWSLHAENAIDLIKLALSFVFMGIPIFLMLTIYYDPDFFITLNNYFSYLNLMFENLLLPKRVLREIDEHLPHIKGKKVLEFGCGVGSLTKELANKTGSKGEVYATDMSEKSVKIAERRMQKYGHGHVKIIHDVHQINRVHDSVPKVDAVVSFGMLGYIQDINKVLKEIHDILPDSGRIIFVDFVDLFKILPNVNWLAHEEKLMEIFRQAGFSVNVKKIKTPLWNYLMVYGIKSEFDVPYV
ncbi:MAG: amino acid permease [Nanoarchaeota archaeon]